MRKTISKVGALAMAVAMLGAPTISNSGGAQEPTKNQSRDAVRQDVKPVHSMRKKNLFGGITMSSGNPAGRFLNQRQYRKKCRQNPHLYGSKKHRSKN